MQTRCQGSRMEFSMQHSCKVAQNPPQQQIERSTDGRPPSRMSLLLSESCFLRGEAALGSCVARRPRTAQMEQRRKRIARPGRAMSQCWHRCRCDIMSQAESSSLRLHQAVCRLKIPPASRRTKPHVAFESRLQSERVALLTPAVWSSGLRRSAT